MNEKTTSITNMNYADILKLPLDTVVSPQHEKDYYATIADALALSAIWSVKLIPEDVIIAFGEAHPVNKKAVLEYANQWNLDVAKDPTSAGFNKASVLGDMVGLASIISANTQSPDKERLLVKAMTAVALKKS